MPHPFLDGAGPVAIAHRGFTAGAADVLVENTLPAFAAAVALGVRHLETDVRATQDGVLVAIHDATLERITGGDHRAVADLTWRQLRGVRVGRDASIPRLEEVLTTWPQVKVNIDVKTAAAIAPLAGVLARTRSARRVCVASFSDLRRVSVLRRCDPRPATSTGWRRTGLVVAAAAGPGRLSHLLTAMAATGVDCLQLPPSVGAMPLVTGRLVRAAHRAGLAVHVWTVDDAADQHRLLDLGVDGIVTDRVDTLRDVLRSRGQWAP